MQIKKRYADAGITVWNIGNTSVHNMPEVTLNLPGPRPEDRGVQAVPAQPRQGRHPLHDLRAHGQRHLDQRPDARSAVRRRASSIRTARTRAGNWDGKVYHRTALARTRVHEGRDLGELHLLHQAGGAGGRRSGRPDRHPPGRSAGAGAGRRAALHLQQLRRLQAGDGDRQQSERRHLPVLRDLARRRQEAHRQGSGGDDPRTSARRRSGRSTSATSARRCRTSSRRSWTTATTTCGRS